MSAVLRATAGLVKPGITTLELDKFAEKLIRQGGDLPAFLGYKPNFSPRAFPASLCTSVNDEVVHGIPSKRGLIAGDIVGLDLGLMHKGLYVDMAMTVAVGKIDETDEKLIEATKQALMVGVAVLRDGARMGDIGAAIEAVADRAGFGVVRELGGHGVGHEIHEEPFIPHFGKRGKGEMLEENMVVCIEPQLNIGRGDVIFDEADGYTVRTSDGSKSAHFELTVAIGKNGPQILTPPSW